MIPLTSGGVYLYSPKGIDRERLMLVTSAAAVLESRRRFIVGQTVMSSHDGDTLTVPITVAKFIQPYSILWGDVGAAATIQLVPILVVVFLLQRHIMRGISLGAVK